MNFSRTLRRWYQVNKRDLPWRSTNDPYRIWLSEVILQQTQVRQGTAYYHRFLEALPDVQALAAADEDQVLRLWQGLGYYSRARNLHAAAKAIMKEHGGRFPHTYEAIRHLKGIGDYTASAIASFAFGLPHPVVDGNVARVLARYFAVQEEIDSSAGKKRINALAARVFDEKFPAEHNQAIMEFGALHCTPRNPDCSSCIFRSSCGAYGRGLVQELPLKKAKATVRTRHFNYVLVADRLGNVLLNRRREGDIWQGLYEFKLLESTGPVPASRVMRSKEVRRLCGESASLVHVSEPFVHVLSHQKLHARFLVVRSSARFSHDLAVPFQQLGSYAFPRLIGRFLEQVDLKEIL